MLDDIERNDVEALRGDSNKENRSEDPTDPKGRQIIRLSINNFVYFSVWAPNNINSD